MSSEAKASENAPKVENLKEMLQFQAHAIVSRMLAKNSGGSVTLFAFDEGESLSEHTAPFDALVIGVEGSARVTIGGASHGVGEGEAILMPAHVPHAVNPLGRFKMLLVMIRGEKAAGEER
jgi:quercetin dioxygenase-like cupin family protein